jgi:hypothetical protein
VIVYRLATFFLLSTTTSWHHLFTRPLKFLESSWSGVYVMLLNSRKKAKPTCMILLPRTSSLGCPCRCALQLHWEAGDRCTLARGKERISLELVILAVAKAPQRKASWPRVVGGPSRQRASIYQVTRLSGAPTGYALRSGNPLLPPPEQFISISLRFEINK